MTTLLVIDIGNTNVSLGVFAYRGDDLGKHELTQHWRISTDQQQTSDELGLTLGGLFDQAGTRRADVTDVIISSVVPPMLPIWERVSTKLFDRTPMVVGPGIRTGMPVRYENPREVGADRIVNAVAAFEMFGGPVIAVDFGTATTFDCVSADGEYLGGVIFPGIHTSMEALFARASMLHRVEIARPKQVIGKTTTAAIQSGLLFGFAGVVDSMVERIREELGSEARVVATGGLAHRVGGESRSIERVEPFLTLEGLRIIFEKNRPQAELAKGETRMKNVKVGDTHSFALVGHSGDGKTSVGEALLHAAGATEALGSVTAGTSALNFVPEEQERHTTISTAIFGFDWNDKHLTLVDTPGDSNFQADGRVALHGVDGAVLVVSGVDGAKVGTQRMLQHCRHLGVPALAFVNSLDRERANFDAAVESLRAIDANPAVLTLPIGAEAGFRGCVDLVHRKAYTADGEGDVPEELGEAVESAREQLIESVAESDDTLLEKYLDEGELQEDELLHGLLAATRQGKLTPVLCGAATSELGTPALLRAVTELLPSAADAAPRLARDADDGEVEVAAAAEGPFAGLVIKTQIDRYAGTLSLVRIVSGTLHADTSVLNATTGDRERIGKLLLLRGEQHEDVPEAGPGDIIALAKLKSVRTGHALSAEKGGVHLPEIEIPQGVISYAISARSKGDEDKLYTSLARLVEEDPTLHVGREASTGEFLLSGMGELHVRITAQKLKRMFGVEVELHTPKVPYRETVTRKAENVEGKLKKQTGGKGMFGVCYLTVEPKARGEGVEFSDEVVGGAIPRNLIPAVEKGVMEGCVAGPLAGYPVVDLKVRCIDGKHHPVDSNEMAFKLAASFGFKAAVQQARPTLLEPIMVAEVSAPSDHVGDIMGDISSRRGKVQSTEAKGNATVVQAQVPMAEMLEYASALTSMTGGQGEFHMEFSHYEEAPAQVREKIIAAAEAAKASAS